MNRKEIKLEDIKAVHKLFLNPPTSKMDDLAKLFKKHITGEIHDKIIAAGQIPIGVVLNRAKIQDEDFLALAIYSLDKYFNIRWLTISSKEADAVTFVFIENHFYFVHNREMMNHISHVDLYQLYPLNQL